MPKSDQGFKASILAYHHVCRRLYPTISRVTPAKFKSQLGLIQEDRLKTDTLSGYFGTGNKFSSAQFVLLTFDDGLRCFYDNALPLLLQRNMTATIFVLTEFVGRTSGWDYYRSSHACRHLDWVQLRELADLGFEIGSHSCNHVDLKSCNRNTAKNELERSKKTLEDKLSIPVNFFSFPFGRLDHRLEALCRGAGYVGAVSQAPGSVNDNLHNLNRNAVYLFENKKQFGLKINSGDLSQLESIKLRTINRLSIGTVILKSIHQKALAS